MLEEMEFTPLLVVWLDARKGEEPRFKERFKGMEPVPIWTVGFGYRRQDCIILAQDYYPLEAGDTPEDECFRQWVVIPIACVQKVIELKEG